MGVRKPEDITKELEFVSLEAVMVGDRALFAEGSEDSLEGVFDDVFAFSGYIMDPGSRFFYELGELAEMPGKTESKITKLKTRNYQIPGKRTSTVELTLNGISDKQRGYFESVLFSEKELVIILIPNELFNHDLDDEEDWDFESGVVVFAGLRWTADWHAEADGLWTVGLSTEFSGPTSERIYAQHLAAHEIEDKEGEE